MDTWVDWISAGSQIDSYQLEHTPSVLYITRQFRKRIDKCKNQPEVKS